MEKLRIVFDSAVKLLIRQSKMEENTCTSLEIIPIYCGQDDHVGDQISSVQMSPVLGSS